MEGHQYPFPDFSINHQCRDFEAILQWRLEHEVNGSMYEAIRPPAGLVPMRPPEQLVYDIISKGKGGFLDAALAE